MGKGPLEATSTADTPPPVVRLLSDEVRWQLVRALARGDHRVRELVQMVGQPYNLVSYHLRQLKGSQLVREHRSSRDARDVYYSLDLDALRRDYLASADSLHPAVGQTNASQPEEIQARVALPKPRILILCTRNSCRSQMAEGLLRSMSLGEIEVMSAGSEPTTVNPDAIVAMARAGIDISGQQSKSMMDLVGQHFDYVITVCDSVREVCPLFPGGPERIHWSFADPSEVRVPEERQQAFDQTITSMRTRLAHLITLIRRERGLGA